MHVEKEVSYKVIIAAIVKWFDHRIIIKVYNKSMGLTIDFYFMNSMKSPEKGCLLILTRGRFGPFDEPVLEILPSSHI